MSMTQRVSQLKMVYPMQITLLLLVVVVVFILLVSLLILPHYLEDNMETEKAWIY